MRIVFMDEFLFFDPRALPVILPTLANGAALVLTSSIAPNAADDLMRLFEAKYADGTRVVNVLNWIEACPACTKANRADRCTHVVRRPQHFQKGSDQVRVLIWGFSSGLCLLLTGLCVCRTVFVPSWVSSLDTMSAKCSTWPTSQRVGPRLTLRICSSCARQKPSTRKAMRARGSLPASTPTQARSRPTLRYHPWP